MSTEGRGEEAYAVNDFKNISGSWTDPFSSHKLTPVSHAKPCESLALNIKFKRA